MNIPDETPPLREFVTRDGFITGLLWGTILRTLGRSLTRPAASGPLLLSLQLLLFGFKMAGAGDRLLSFEEHGQVGGPRRCIGGGS